jgi:hypothetical protein
MYLLVLVPLFAWLGHREAASFARKNGRSPWGLPPLVWAVFTGASLLVGGVLLAVARRTTSPVPVPALPVADGSGRPVRGPVFGQDILPRG